MSPPPTTAISLPRKKKPSQVAQAETPPPERLSSSSFWMPIHLALAPVAMMSASQVYSPWSLATR